MDYFNTIGKTYGLEDLPLKIFGFLYIQPNEVPMDEIAKRTGYSLASISNTMKHLENMGIINRIRKPGSKKVYFYMDKDIIKFNLKKLDSANEIIVKAAKERVPLLLKKYKHLAVTEEDQKRIRIIENYGKQVELFEELIIKWKKDLETLSKKTVLMR